eukprot:1146309-Prorocentrum_minimum.AAC.1
MCPWLWHTSPEERSPTSHPSSPNLSPAPRQASNHQIISYHIISYHQIILNQIIGPPLILGGRTRGSRTPPPDDIDAPPVASTPLSYVYARVVSHACRYS